MNIWQNEAGVNPETKTLLLTLNFLIAEGNAWFSFCQRSQTVLAVIFADGKGHWFSSELSLTPSLCFGQKRENADVVYA